MTKISRTQLLRAFSRLPRTRLTEKLPGAVKLLSAVMPVHESAIQSLRAITPLHIRQLLKGLSSPLDTQKIVTDPALSNLLEIKEINFEKGMIPVLLAKGHNIHDISAQKVFPVIYRGFKVEAPLSVQPMLPIISVNVSAEKVNVAYTGNSGSSGIGLGKARRLEPWEKEYPITKFTVTDTAKEIDRFRKAVKAATKTIKEESAELAAKPETKALAISCQSMWDATLGSEVPDPQNAGQKISLLEATVVGKILAEKSNAEVFLMEFITDRARNYENIIEDAYIRDRWRDIIGSGRLILEKLLRIPTRKPLEKQEANLVLVVPGELYQTDFRKLRAGFMHLKAIVTETGSPTSHVSILARALGVPAVVGLGEAINKIQDGDFIVVDGGTGRIITKPNSHLIEQYKEIQEEYNQRIRTIRDEVKGKRIDIDGHSVKICGNIISADELSLVIKEEGRGGVGLFRTEYLYSSSAVPPTEDELVGAFKKLKAGSLDRIVVRTFDFGGDKAPPAYLRIPNELTTSFTGLRGIRLYNSNPECQKAIQTQLRALLRASATNAQLEIMAPMISRVEEYREFKNMVNELKGKLRDEGHKFNSQIKIGAMIEVPSIVDNAWSLAQEADFFSIGTNDLIGAIYSLDRGLSLKINVGGIAQPLDDPYDRAVLYRIKRVVKAGREAKIPVSLCGNEGGDPLFALLLVGMGIDSISVNPPDISNIKYVLLGAKLEECQKLLTIALSRDIHKYQGNTIREKLKNALMLEGFSSELLKRVDYIDKLKHLGLR